MNNMESQPQSQPNVIGNHATVTFAFAGNKQLMSKIDTGATTSSLHATNIKTNGSQVSFVCDELSPNIITMDVEGAQTVTTSDNGGEQRPMIKTNVQIGDVVVNDAVFNLNDRTNMDSKVLIGQNILQAGHFVVDVNKDNDTLPNADEIPDHSPNQSTKLPENVDFNEKILYAIQVLAESNITLAEILQYLRTEAISSSNN